MAGFSYGIPINSRKRGILKPLATEPMSLFTQIILALLQELLVALRANDTDDFSTLLYHSVQELAMPVMTDLMLDWADRG